MTAPDAQAGTVAAVIRGERHRHENVGPSQGVFNIRCKCGHRGYRVSEIDEFEQHVDKSIAAALAAAGLTTEADQPRDGLRAAVEALTPGLRHEANILRDRAGVISVALWLDQQADDLDRALLADQPPTPDEGGAA